MFLWKRFSAQVCFKLLWLAVRLWHLLRALTLSHIGSASTSRLGPAGGWTERSKFCLCPGNYSEYVSSLLSHYNRIDIEFGPSAPPPPNSPPASVSNSYPTAEDSESAIVCGGFLLPLICMVDFSYIHCTVDLRRKHE
jgi:hypothetical protein